MKVASVCTVKVPSSIDMVSEEGVQNVVYVVGPNMNPMRPDPITDEDKALKALGDCYQAVFQAFAETVGLNAGEGGGDAKPKNAFDKLMNSRKAAAAAANEYAAPKRSNYSWDNGLMKYVDAPEKHPNIVQQFDDDFVTINDVYPKAAKHFLIMPRVKIESIFELRKEHLDLLAKMKSRADDIAKAQLRFPKRKFLIGFHSVPSMKQLHLHVISDDFVAPALKTKRHWNSFTTRFFLPYMLVRQMIEEDGKITIDKEEYEQLLKGPLICHKCTNDYNNIRELKMHLERHLKQDG
ncbi:HIT-like domain-containing protein [Chytridium lagenaria]|nr:HIT-like domain-containing protein [Chytridium lagenaria]